MTIATSTSSTTGSNANGTNGAHGSTFDAAQFLSTSAKSRPASAIRSLFPAESIPGMVSLLAGKPNASTFPIGALSLTLKPGAEGDTQRHPITLDITGEDLEAALQYSATAGLPRLREWLTDFTVHIHGRALVESDSGSAGHDAPWRMTIGNGSQDLLQKAFDAILDEGDSVLVECPAYTGILPMLEMLKVNIIPVLSDSEGVSSKELAHVLESWSSSPTTSTLRFPKLLYTTPTGANPAGTTASEGRKREILQLVRQHSFLLFEDDPYYFLSFQGLGEGTPETRPRSKSYWALEEEDKQRWGTGRVLRFESLSKVLSAGLRIGFLVGPLTIVDAIDKSTSVTNLQPSGPPQAIAIALLQYWGFDGFLRHADSIANFYRRRRDVFEGKAREILGASKQSGDVSTRPSVATWVTPVAGMFLWLRLRLPPTASAASKGNSNVDDDGDSFALINDKAKAAGVLAVPGIAFMPGTKRTCFVRTSYSIVPEDQIEIAFLRLRRVIEDSWHDAGYQQLPPE